MLTKSTSDFLNSFWENITTCIFNFSSLFCRFGVYGNIENPCLDIFPIYILKVQCIFLARNIAPYIGHLNSYLFYQKSYSLNPPTPLKNTHMSQKCAKPNLYVHRFFLGCLIYVMCSFFCKTEFGWCSDWTQYQHHPYAYQNFHIWTGVNIYFHIFVIMPHPPSERSSSFHNCSIRRTN